MEQIRKNRSAQPRQARAAAAAAELTVDIHSHVDVPDAAKFVEPHLDWRPSRWRTSPPPETKALNQKQDADIRARGDLDRRLADLDAMGIDIQMVAPPPPQCYYTVPLDIAVKAAQVVNDGIAAFCAGKADRLKGFGSVPMPDGHEAARSSSAASNSSASPASRF